MQISRRSFLGLVGLVPALGARLPHLMVGHELDMIELPPETSELCPRHFSTSHKVIHGPCRVYDFLSSGAGGKFMFVRDTGATLVEWSQHPLALFRWVAAPGGEFGVPAGGSLHVVQMQSQPYVDYEDWVVWTSYERPDSVGKYQTEKPEGYVDFKYDCGAQEDEDE